MRFSRLRPSQRSRLRRLRTRRLLNPSFPAVNHLQYRLTAEGGVTRLQLTHRAVGLFDQQLVEGMTMGFEFWVKRVKGLAETRAGKR